MSDYNVPCKSGSRCSFGRGALITQFLRNSNKIYYNANNATKPVHKRRGYNTGSEDTEVRRAVGAEGVLHERGPICVRTDVSWQDGQVIT